MYDTLYESQREFIRLISFLVFIEIAGDTPKHTDEEMWSTGATLPLSLHLFFNLSGIQSQTRHGYQLYVTAAKLRLFKFAEVN